MSTSKKLTFVENNGKRLYLVGYGIFSDKTMLWLVKNDPEEFKSIKRSFYKKYDFLQKHEYDRIYEKYFNSVNKYADKRQEIVNLFIEARKIGITYTQARYNIAPLYKGILSTFLDECIQESKDFISKQFEIEKDYLIDLHVLRYEEMYRNFIEPDLTKISPAYHKITKANSLLQAVETLVQKERLLGLHSKNFKIRVSESHKQIENKKQKTYDLSYLHLSEQIELLSLINKTKVSDIVVAKSEEVDQNQHNNVAVKIDKKDVIEAPIRLATQTDIIKENEKNTIEISGRSLHDVQTSMKEAVKKQLEAALNKNK